MRKKGNGTEGERVGRGGEGNRQRNGRECLGGKGEEGKGREKGRGGKI